MYQHFVGKVYLFHDVPKSNELFVDLPVMSQGENTPSKLLIQIGAEDLSRNSEIKLAFLSQQSFLSTETIKGNFNISPESQIELAKEILDNIGEYYYSLNWVDHPTYEQLEQTCSLIWKFLKDTIRSRGVNTSKQLAYRINRVVQHKSLQRIIRSRLLYADSSEMISDKIDDELNFVRLWATHNFPKWLRALEAIQRELFSRLGLDPGSYTKYASQLECMFSDPTIVALDEYGIPLQLATKIQTALKPNGNLDEVLFNLKNLDILEFELTDFEIEVINDSKKYL